MGGTELFEGCQNPHGCGRLAVETITIDGTNVELCAYCASDVRDNME